MKKIITLTPAPDGYRGDLDCLEILTPHSVGEVVRLNPFGGSDPEGIYECLDTRYEIIIDGELAGHLYSYHGNNGIGKLASEVFVPAEGWQVEWIFEE